MRQYLDILQKILDTGEKSTVDRTGAGTIGIFHHESRFNLQEGFPIVTTKPVYWKGVAEELFWFLRGETNIRSLVEKKVNIWSSDALRFNLKTVLEYNLFSEEEIKGAQAKAKEARTLLLNEFMNLEEKNAKFNELMAPANTIQKRFEQKILEDEGFALKAGELGPIYGAQWRGKSKTQPIDQLKIIEEALTNKKYNRRLIVNAWNPQDMPNMALPPCHYNWVVNVSPESQKLTLSWNQRSCDSILGIPFNIASYALLANLLAHTHGYSLGELVGKFEDTHIYLPHIPAAKEQLTRNPFLLPKLTIKNRRNLVADYTMDDLIFEGAGYKPHKKLENPTPMYGGFF